MESERPAASDWQDDLRAALRDGRIEDAQRAGLLGLFAARWARVCAVARRRLDHDACFVVAECALQKLGAYAARSIAETGAPPEVQKPWGLIRRYVRFCIANLPPGDVAPEDPPEPAVLADPDLLAAIAICFDRLAPEDQAVLRLTLDPDGDKAAAVALRLSPAGVRTRRHRARLALRACLEARGITVEGGEHD